MTQDAVLLAGSIGLGHKMMAESCAGVLERSGWRTRSLDSLSLMGRMSGRIGQRTFDRLVHVPGLYDGLHFAHLRTGSRLADLMDRAASARLMSALRAEPEWDSADLVLSVFATGASAAAKLKAEAPARRTVVLCTDVSVHQLWVYEGTDLFLVTSTAAEASVRRYLPWADVSVVPPPVRPAFYAAPSQEEAREALGVPAQDFCVLLIDSGWGFGPLVESASHLADAHVQVLAVAGRQQAVERGLRQLARTTPRVKPFGFTNRVPELMAAADVVVALPGAVTCGEARAVGRQLLLLDVMPGHGRDNLQHELELGAAQVCMPTPRGVTASALALRDQARALALQAGSAARWARWQRWEPAFVAALQRVGLDLHPSAAGRVPAPASSTHDGQVTRGAAVTLCARYSFTLPPTRVLTAGLAPVTRPSARFARTGTRPGWRSPPRW